MAAVPPERTCYCVVTPDPGRGLFISDAHGNAMHFLKFGDGNFRESYFTENPSFLSRENTNSPVALKNILDKDAKSHGRRIGKYLEWTYIKHPSFDGAYYGTEWYVVKSKVVNGVPKVMAQQQCEKLANLVTSFEAYDWNENTLRPLDRIMEDIHDNCELR